MAKRISKKGSVGWRPDVNEILNVEPLFPDEKIEALASHLPGFSDMASFRVGVLRAAVVYRADLAYRSAPSAPQRKKIFAGLLGQVSDLRQTIESLDLPSLRALSVDGISRVSCDKAEAEAEAEGATRSGLSPRPAADGQKNAHKNMSERKRRLTGLNRTIRQAEINTLKDQ